MFQLILFGNKTKPKIVGSMKHTCSHCKRRTIHGIVRMKKWFTLYFIPIFPYTNQMHIICGVCGLKQLVKGEARDMVEKALNKKEVAK